MTSIYGQNKYLVYGVGAIALGIGLYFLSRDEETEIVQVYDPKVHTLEKLKVIIDEIFIESATLYCQKLRLIREAKKDGTFNGKEQIETLTETQRKDMKDAEEDTYKEYKITEELFFDWLARYQDDKYIKERQSKLIELHKNIFGSETGDGTIQHMVC